MRISFVIVLGCVAISAQPTRAQSTSDLLDVTGMRAIYNPATGDVRFEGLTNIHGVGVNRSGDVRLNPAGAVSGGSFSTASDDEIGWLFFDGIAGGAYDAGPILQPGLGAELSKYYIGVTTMGSGKSVTPIPIVSLDGEYLPDWSPFVPRPSHRQVSPFRRSRLRRHP